MGYISPEPMYPDRGDISAPLDADVSLSKDSQHASVLRGKETPLLRLRNGALQAGLNERLQRVVAMRKVRQKYISLFLGIQIHLSLSDVISNCETNYFQLTMAD